MEKKWPYSYEWMLERAYQLMPPIVFEKKRFEVPKASVFIQGKSTVIRNFKEIADTLNRDPKHIMKFLGKELGAAWRIEQNRAVLSGKFSSFLINQKIEKYTKLYVICPVCGKPDTKLIKIDRVEVMKCLACGAISPVPPL